ncbi:DUF3159 domain-containing protein [Nocardiopsis sp. N85]|uniref:DUF3159 domain-containing protein n=1 Tax=Nocardiopsis sp. N85 TaxID=3029400 RepID=UPI00237F1830|nr:DUF3159 domain-containing protein [Nocardiopsis sp. N85]MDE3721903.1 DUF3159 domain-containing protein [Nocardiopsis sp. N85]
MNLNEPIRDVTEQTETANTDHTGRAGHNDRAEPPADLKQEVLRGLGGVSGMVYSALPVVVFAATVPFIALSAAISAAIALALILGAYRLWRGERIMPALGGVIAVAAAGGIAASTGSANDFFLFGIWSSLVLALLTLGTVLARRPVTGLVWNLLHGNSHAWRQDPPSLRIHDLATLAVTAVLAARFVVRQWMYLADSTTGLAVADTVTGFPLTVAAVLVIVWAFRRTTRRLVEPDGSATGPRG